jgi:diaminopimelate epimerase
MKMKKVHGSENDFFLIDETLLPQPLTTFEIEALRKYLTDRESGLLGGADGLLLVEESDEESHAVAKMRVINRDGSEASMCGNGLRTVARYLSEKYQLYREFTVQTMFAELCVCRAKDFMSGLATYRVEISPVSFEPEKLGMNKAEAVIEQRFPELSEDLIFSAVAVPNPHLIAFVDHETLVSDEFERIALLVNGENDLFPDGVNVTFVEILGENQLFARTFERGVGFTNACGTAMSASSLMYVLLQGGSLDTPISVRNLGGLVETVVHQQGVLDFSIDLIGNATVTHEVVADFEDLIAGNFENAEIIPTEEQELYENFIRTIVDSFTFL